MNEGEELTGMTVWRLLALERLPALVTAQILRGDRGTCAGALKTEGPHSDAKVLALVPGAHATGSGKHNH